MSEKSEKETCIWDPNGKRFPKIKFHGLALRLMWGIPERRKAQSEFTSKRMIEKWKDPVYRERQLKKVHRKRKKSESRRLLNIKKLADWRESPEGQEYHRNLKLQKKKHTPEQKKNFSKIAKRRYQHACPFFLVDGVETEEVERERFNNHSGVLLESDLEMAGGLNG